MHDDFFRFSMAFIITVVDMKSHNGLRAEENHEKLLMGTDEDSASFCFDSKTRLGPSHRKYSEQGDFSRILNFRAYSSFRCCQSFRFTAWMLDGPGPYICGCHSKIFYCVQSPSAKRAEHGCPNTIFIPFCTCHLFHLFILEYISANPKPKDLYHMNESFSTTSFI